MAESGFPAPVGWDLRGVTFTYEGTSKPIIENLSLNIQPGQTFVITGPSGVGKSTLLSLLLGGISPSTGSISLLSGSESSHSLESQRPRLLKSIGYVGPESFLIEGTIRENLAYGIQMKISDEEISSALQKAECQFVFSLDGRLDYRISEQGQGLSAGQKQRLALARALLRRPKVLILDEATANLDVDTEEKIIDILEGLKNDMTIVAVTHRQSLLRIADYHLKF